MPSEEVTAGGKELGALKRDGAVCPRKEDLKLCLNRATGTQAMTNPGSVKVRRPGNLEKGCEVKFTAQYSGQ